MPRRARKVCSVQGCPELALHGRSLCEKHQADRPKRAPHGYGEAWKRTRAAFIEAHPWCDVCGSPATVAHHIIERRAGGSDNWANLQPLCASCHSRHHASLRSGRATAER